MRHLLGEDYARKLENQARQDAEKGQYNPPQPQGKTVQGQFLDAVVDRVYLVAYSKRFERLKRLQND